MPTTLPAPAPRDPRKAALAHLAGRSLSLVGLMGAGKTTVGRRVADLLALPFFDSDHEIEAAARMSVAELFEAYGEPEFRALEARVIARLCEGRQAVISTGGGAFIQDQTRQALLESTVSVWLSADLDLLMARVARRPSRPLLKAPDPRAVMADLMARRYPIYAQADFTVISRDARREVIAQDVVDALAAGAAGKERT